jgi:hypothetical protein
VRTLPPLAAVFFFDGDINSNKRMFLGDAGAAKAVSNEDNCITKASIIKHYQEAGELQSIPVGSARVYNDTNSGALFEEKEIWAYAWNWFSRTYNLSEIDYFTINED